LLNRDDEERKDQGYYNRLLDTGLGAEASQAICRGVPELREVVLVSNLSIVRAKGTTWRTNELGMRDRSYSVSKPKGTLRIAMAGDSIGVALGVSEGLGFEPALECWLDDQSRRRGGSRVELLNFSVPGRSPGQRWDHFQKIGWPMNPDIVIFEATAADIGWDAQRLADLLPRGIGWDTPLYGDVLKRLTPMASATSESYAQALRPYRWDLLGAVYQAVAADCRAHGVPCVWMLIPRVGRAVEPAQKARLLDLARAAEFTAIVDVSDAFDGYDPARLAIHPSDFHPDAAGHALLARRLARELAPLPVLDRIRQPPGTHVENARRDDRRGNHAS
jgi:lysophospholipase L1-like esterase